MLHDPGGGAAAQHPVGDDEPLDHAHRAFANAIRAAVDRYAAATGIAIDAIAFGPRDRYRHHADAQPDPVPDPVPAYPVTDAGLVFAGAAVGDDLRVADDADADPDADAVADLSHAAAGGGVRDGRVEADLTVAAVESFGHAKLILMARGEAVLINCADAGAPETLLRELSRLVHERGIRT